jgi:Flp pilus assembly protein TadD
MLRPSLSAHWPALAALAFAAMLAGCQSNKSATDPTITGSIAKPTTTQGYQQASGYWSTRYNAAPKDKTVALQFAAALQREGTTDQAVAVLRKAAMVFPTDRDVLAAYGKALAADGQFDQALDAVRRAQTPQQPDWRLVSAEAAILDQTGRTAEARKLYAKALALKPNDPAVLSNLGMSYVMTNELVQAEATLRLAIAQPGADSRVRQNLALVVGLQGRFDEAQTIATAELSPEAAATNIAYLRAMMQQQATLKRLKNPPIADPAG